MLFDYELGVQLYAYGQLSSSLFSRSEMPILQIADSYACYNIYMDQENKHYQLFVIGGGSGGLSCARAAAALGVRVGLADFVKPSPPGTKWGLGGTCVNVGCIPKKLFHFTGLLGESRKDLQGAGWQVSENATHSWQTASQKITDHIKSLNFGYRKNLNNEKVEYHNKLAKFVSANTLELTGEDGSKETVTADKIVIATGGRPTYPDIPGSKEHAITSDDIFWLPKPPGKTLIVGASYISLECAGFLHGMGLDVTVMVRSIFLRGFDQQMADKVGEYMQMQGVKFIRNAVPTQIKLNSQNRKIVTYKQNQQEIQDIYDTVLFAIGRSADTQGLALDKVGVKTAKNGKIICKDDDSTDVKDVYAIGDVVEGRLQLTPTAIMAGRLLAQRLFAGGKIEMSYKYVPTTVFTPLQYGCCGYSQQQAIKKYGEQNIVAYASKFKPLEWNMSYERQGTCYAKLVTLKSQNYRVIGFHYLGPNAGEVTQGFALGMRKGATKQDFDLTVGIHPTCAQEFTTLKAIAGSDGEAKQGC